MMFNMKPAPCGPAGYPNNSSYNNNNENLVIFVGGRSHSEFAS